LLLRAGYNVNVRDTLGRTPLHIAILSEELEVATTLISSKADINSEDSDGRTPLRLAIGHAIKHGRRDFIELLLRRSAHTENIIADEWRNAYGKQASDIIMLSERQSGEKSVRLSKGKSVELLDCFSENESLLILSKWICSL